MATPSLADSGLAKSTNPGMSMLLYTVMANLKNTVMIFLATISLII
jgi:hypothetical protein